MNSTLRRIGDVLIFTALMCGLGFCGSQVFAALRERPQGGTYGDQIASLSEWRASHQRDDDKQFRELADLSARIAQQNLENEKRLTTLEMEYVATRRELDSFSARLWALVLGICLQLASAAWGYVKQKADSRGRRNP